MKQLASELGLSKMKFALNSLSKQIKAMEAPWYQLTINTHGLKPRLQRFYHLRLSIHSIWFYDTMTDALGAVGASGPWLLVITVLTV